VLFDTYCFESLHIDETSQVFDCVVRLCVYASMVTGGIGGSGLATPIAALATALAGIGLGVQQPRPLVVAHTCECVVDLPYQPQVLAIVLGVAPPFIAFVIGVLCPRSCRRRRGFVEL
jgi:hypothetical protein